jgi:hypothetical protein
MANSSWMASWSEVPGTTWALEMRAGASQSTKLIIFDVLSVVRVADLIICRLSELGKGADKVGGWGGAGARGTLTPIGLQIEVPRENTRIKKGVKHQHLIGAKN